MNNEVVGLITGNEVSIYLEKFRSGLDCIIYRENMQ